MFCLFCFIPCILPSWPVGTTNCRFPKCHLPRCMYCPSLITPSAFRNIYAISLSDSLKEKGLGSWPLIMERGRTGFLQTLMLQKYLVCTSERIWKNWSQLPSSTALLKAVSRTLPVILSTLTLCALASLEFLVPKSTILILASNHLYPLNLQPKNLSQGPLPCTTPPTHTHTNALSSNLGQALLTLQTSV